MKTTTIENPDQVMSLLSTLSRYQEEKARIDGMVTINEIMVGLVRDPSDSGPRETFERMTAMSSSELLDLFSDFARQVMIEMGPQLEKVEHLADQVTPELLRQRPDLKGKKAVPYIVWTLRDPEHHTPTIVLELTGSC